MVYGTRAGLPACFGGRSTTRVLYPWSYILG